MTIHGLLLYLGAVLLVHVAASAQPVAYTIEKIALQGDTEPEGRGPMHQLMGDVDLDAEGRVVFHTNAQVGSPAPWGIESQIVMYDAGNLSILVRTGDPAAGTGGQTFGSLGYVRMLAPSTLTWGASYGPPPSEAGVFLRDAGVDAPIALQGAPAPGGGSFTGNIAFPVMNLSREVAFLAEIDSGVAPLPFGVFLSRSTGLVPIARSGQAAPASTGGVFAQLEFVGRSALAGDGTVHFWGGVEGGSVPHGLFRWSPASGLTAVLTPGSVLQMPEGGTVHDAFSPSSNEEGDVSVAVDVLRPGDPSPMQGIYVLEAGGAQREVIRRGDRLPGAGGDTFRSIVSPPRINAAGDVAFTAELEESFLHGVYVSRGDAIAKVAFGGDTVPGAPGAVWGQIIEVEMNDAGEIAFFALTSAGPGVFLATPFPVQVPFAPPWAPGALGVALALAARRLRSAARR